MARLFRGLPPVLARMLAEDRQLATGEPLDYPIDLPERGPARAAPPLPDRAYVDRDTLIVRTDVDHTGHTTTLVRAHQMIPPDSIICHVRT
jgi:hypothetical protein